MMRDKQTRGRRWQCRRWLLQAGIFSKNRDVESCRADDTEGEEIHLEKIVVVGEFRPAVFDLENIVVAPAFDDSHLPTQDGTSL